MRDEFEIVRIHIPGDWRDIWLYKDYMLLWSRSGLLHIIPVQQIIRYIEMEVDITTAVILQHLLFRNDWKASEQFRRMLAIPSLRNVFSRSIRECSENIVVVPDSIGEISAAQSVPGVLLDA